MKTTNVFLEVDDLTYNLVVAPHKKNKTFTKLIKALLKSYMEDQYVRASVEGSLDNLRQESEDSLNSAIEDITQSLATFGLYTDEMGMTTSQGKDFFSGKVKEYSKKGVAIPKEDSHVSKTVEEDPVVLRIKEENEALKEEISDIKKQFKETSSEISKLYDLMTKMMSESSVESMCSSEISDVEDDLSLSNEMEKDSPNESVTSEEESTQDISKMMDLMSGNFMSF